MSRLDIFTIVVVVICVAAIVFLLYRTTDLFKSKDALNEAQQTEESLYEDDGTTGDDYTEDPYSTDTTAEFDFLADTASETTTPSTPSQSKPPVTKPATPEAKPTTPATSPPPAPKVEKPIVNVDEMSSSGGDFLVLAGAFTVMANAEAYSKRLQKLGFSDAQVALFNKGKYATVLVGRFESKSDANSLVSQLGGKGVEAYVHLKRGSSAKN